MSVTPRLPEAAITAVRPPRPRVSRRLLALAVVCAALAVLGVGALADTLAIAPLHPPTQREASQRAGLDSITLSITPEPLTAGQDTAFVLRVSDVTGAAVNDALLVCEYTMPAMPMPTMLITARAGGGGVYTCQETLTDPGAWLLTVTLRMPGAASVHTAFSLQAR